MTDYDGPQSGTRYASESDEHAAADDPLAHRRPHLHKPTTFRNLVEWLAIIATALILAVVIQRVFIQAFWIPSESMEATLDVGDRVLVNKLSYRFGDIERGDVVVFERPPNSPDANPKIKDLIKRVVALPGEKVELRNNEVYVNGEKLDEPYLEEGTPTTAQVYLKEPLTVPEGKVLVMGDNRTNSQDGRTFGPIDEDLIVGRAFVKVWPVTDFGLL